MRMNMRHTVAATFALFLALSGCSDSHGRGDDAGAMDAGRGDAGGSAFCGAAICGAGQRCCSGCPGSPDFCGTGDMCPLLSCPPPPPGCEICGVGELCCGGCPGEGSSCFVGSTCPPPPPCPPPLDCDDTRPCPDGLYCDRGDACRGPGTCFPIPEECTEDCPGVCGCDGRDYCNSCIAARAGVTVSHAGSCAPTTCAGRPYCDCVDVPGCEPLVDTTTGCVCPCDDPFNCTGEMCDCACGGAMYRDCAPVGRCPVTELSCGVDCSALLGSDGCLQCLCFVPG